MRLFWVLALTVCALSLSGAPVHSVTLAWTWTQTDGDPATGFHVQRSVTKGGPYTIIGTAPATATAYVDNAVKAGETWYYVVTAFNGGGDAVPSNEAPCTVPFQAPAGTTTLQVTVK